MSTKIFSIFNALIIAVTLMGCSQLTNESPPARDKVTPDFGYDSKCLANTLPVLRGFLSGTAQAHEVARIWNCFDGALNLFYRKVKGENPNYYTPREITNFFEYYFLADDVKINDKLMGQLMNLKQILVGGQADQITRSELLRLIDFAREAKDISLDMLPYMQVFSMKWKAGEHRKAKEDLEYFERANERIQVNAKRIGDRIAANKQDYRLENIATLLEEIESLYTEKWEFVQDVRRMLPLISKLKKSLVGGDEWVVGATEWRRFGLLGARGYVQFLRYHFFIDQQEEDPGFYFFARSVEDLFSYLGDMVREKPDGKFTKPEMNEILASLHAIFPKINISPAFVDEAMKIKVAVFGGSADLFIPNEFDQAKDKIESIRGVAEKAGYYQDFYLFKWKASSVSWAVGQKYFEGGSEVLQEIAVKIASFFEGSYDLNGIYKLAQEWEKAFPTEDGQKTFEPAVKKFLPVIIAGKNIILKDQGATVVKAQWPDLLKFGSELYTRGLYYNYFLADQKGQAPRDWKAGWGLESLGQMLTLSLNTVDRILAKRSSPVIAMSELDQVLIALDRSDILPSQLDAKILSPVVRIALQRFLQPTKDRLNGRRVSGLTTIATKEMRNEFGMWVDGQRFINRAFSETNGLSGSRLAQMLSDQKPILWAHRELKATLVSPVPLTFDSAGRMYISSTKPRLYSKEAMYKMNLGRAVVRLAQKGYATSMDRVTYYEGISLSEANTAFKELKPLGVRMGMIEASNTTFADSRFREANLFTPHADGNDLLSYREGVDLFLMIFSGLELDDSMEKAFFNSCTIHRGKTKRDHRASKTCFLNVYRSRIDDVFTSVPGMSRFAVNLPKENFDVMMVNLLKATGWTDDQSGWIRFGDLGLVPHVMQYIEMTLTRFDEDRDGALNRVEAINAYPIFRSMLAKAAKSDDEKLLKPVFAYILVYGKIPETMAEKVHFITQWVNQEGSWPINADRAQIIKVLGFIMDMIAKENAAKN